MDTPPTKIYTLSLHDALPISTSTLSSTQIRDLMTGAKVRVRSGMSGDTVTLTVSGDPAELKRGLQLAYLLLTDPVIERSEEHTSELQSHSDLVCRLLLEKKKK